jgi:hypothetical protein
MFPRAKRFVCETLFTVVSPSKAGIVGHVRIDTAASFAAIYGQQVKLVDGAADSF